MLRQVLGHDMQDCCSSAYYATDVPTYSNTYVSSYVYIIHQGWRVTRVYFSKFQPKR